MLIVKRSGIKGVALKKETRKGRIITELKKTEILNFIRSKLREKILF